MATRGDWKLGANGLSRSVMERGASWGQQLNGIFAKRIPVFWTSQGFMHTRPFSSPYGMLISVLVCCCM